jgi:fumarate hydratase class II
MGQSSNDTVPTAMHIAAHKMAMQKTILALNRLHDAIEQRKRLDRRGEDRPDAPGGRHSLTVGEEWSGYTGGSGGGRFQFHLFSRCFLPAGGADRGEQGQ